MYISFEKHIAAGQRLPRLYRIAYIDYARGWVMAYPAGIHLIVKYCRRFREWTYRFTPSKIEELVREARADERRQVARTLMELQQENNKLRDELLIERDGASMMMKSLVSHLLESK